MERKAEKTERKTLGETLRDNTSEERKKGRKERDEFSAKIE